MRLMSWNIQWGRGADGKVDPARTVAAIRSAGEFDVICLQEVACNFEGLPGGSGGDEVAFLAAAFPGYAAVFGAGLDIADGRGGRALFGNLLLSRLPVGQVFRHMLPAPADPDWPAMQRVCVEAVVSSASGPLRVLTTHLEYYSARQRGAQVQALRALQVEAAGQARAPSVAKESNPAFTLPTRPAAAVVCGDFNCEPGSAEYQQMVRPLADGVPWWRDAWRVLHPDTAHVPTVGLHGAEWPDRAYCCDFAFVTADLAGRVRSLQVLADTSASDHQPIVLELDDAPAG
ncbi:MAG: endonuclease/exonuclease/phosphatase family protein [Proteobacteria bacterium]|nr:endonuclease/exonuclease/phosphatase family protein [Pseudomonadota bacterium]MBS0551750.1 endonuclease/exonuclease/phosphatase family protein [Pseudomonadota bacterium]